MKLPVYFVSDNHFFMDSPPGENERRKLLFSLFEKIKQEQGTLIIGGDFFDFWFDYYYVLPAGYVDLLEQLDQLNQSGIDIHFVLGNHDYWDFGYFKQKFNAEVYTGNIEFEHNSSRIQVCHGDGLLKNDTGYRFMKKVIRSRFMVGPLIELCELSELAKSVSRQSHQAADADIDRIDNDQHDQHQPVVPDRGLVLSPGGQGLANQFSFE